MKQLDCESWFLWGWRGWHGFKAFRWMLWYHERFLNILKGIKLLLDLLAVYQCGYKEIHIGKKKYLQGWYLHGKFNTYKEARYMGILHNGGNYNRNIIILEKLVLLKYHLNNNRKSNREHLERGWMGDLKI